MPRAERRKRENRKLLITSAKKIPKIYSFLKSKCSVSAEAEDDIGVNVTTAQCICEPTSKTTAFATVTVSESEISSTYDVDRNGDSSSIPEVLAAVSPSLLPRTVMTKHPQSFHQLYLSHQLRLTHSQAVFIRVVLR